MKLTVPYADSDIFCPSFLLSLDVLIEREFYHMSKHPKFSKILLSLLGACKCVKRRSVLFEVSLVQTFASFHIQESQQKVTSHPSQDMWP